MTLTIGLGTAVRFVLFIWILWACWGDGRDIVNEKRRRYGRWKR